MMGYTVFNCEPNQQKSI